MAEKAAARRAVAFAAVAVAARHVRLVFPGVIGRFARLRTRLDKRREEPKLASGRADDCGIETAEGDYRTEGSGSEERRFRSRLIHTEDVCCIRLTGSNRSLSLS